jgi:hypothetical protein
MPKGAVMNISNIAGALFPIFFVLALGYLAGKRNTFDADQAAGFSKLALSFALPASLFVSMTDIRGTCCWGRGGRTVASPAPRGAPRHPIEPKYWPPIPSYFAATEQQTVGQSAHMFRCGMMEYGQLWLA